MRLLMKECARFGISPNEHKTADNCVLVSNKIERGAAPLLPR